MSDDEFDTEKRDNRRALPFRCSLSRDNWERIFAEDKESRFNFLVSQTDITEFLGPDHELSRLKARRAIEAEEKKAKKGDGNRRRGKAKADEVDESEIAEAEATEVKGARFTESPPYVKFGKMRDYQIRGLNWMIGLYEKGVSGILADEMGLGKTLQTISMVGYLKNYQKVNGPHLVIVPKSTIQNWMNEFDRWCPSLKVVCMNALKEERAIFIKDVLSQGDFDVVVTTYEQCMMEKTSLKKINWRYCIIDEAHRIKNEKSKLSLVLREFRTTNRFLLTGTPLQNNLHELWALLNFLLPDIFLDAENFDEYFDQKKLGQELDLISRLHMLLKPFMLRRVKDRADVEKSLLPKKMINIYVPMSQMQKEWYKKILLKDIDILNTGGDKGGGKMRLMNILMHLRKCTNHPYLFDGAEPGPPYTTEQHIVDNCGKMVILDKLLKKCKENGDRVLLFTQFTSMLDIFEDYCLWRDYKYCRLDGGTDHADRTESIDAYNAPNSEKFLFMLSTKAGGLGINLMTANVVIIYDSDWNPQNDLQAMDRAHRIGQKKQVYVYRMITDDSVDERIIERSELKMRLDSVVIQSGRLADQNKKLNQKEMLNMIRHGASKIFAGEGKDSLNVDLDIDEVLKAGEKKTEQLTAEYDKIGENAAQKFTFDQDTDYTCHVWNGVDFRDEKKKENKLIDVWIEPPKRERKANYAVDQYFKEALRVNDPKAPKAPRPPKQPDIRDYQFYPHELIPLLEQEVFAYRKQVNYKVPVDPDAEHPKKKQKAEQEKIDNAEPLTEEQIKQRDGYLELGFANWSKRDFNAFIKGSEKYGRGDIKSIAAEIEGKSIGEVTDYHTIFWDRYEEIQDHERLIAIITKGEERIEKKIRMKKALSQKVASYKFPEIQLRIPYMYAAGNRKNYTEEEDRFLVCKLAEFGMDTENAYDNIKALVRYDPKFRFDWFFRSRTSAELQRRCNQLVNIIEREINGPSKDDDNEKKRKRAGQNKNANAKKQKLEAKA